MIMSTGRGVYNEGKHWISSSSAPKSAGRPHFLSIFGGTEAQYAGGRRCHISVISLPIRGAGQIMYAETFPFADETTKWGTATPQYMTGGLWEEPNSVWNDERGMISVRCLPASRTSFRTCGWLRHLERSRRSSPLSPSNGSDERIDKRSFGQTINDLLRPEALENARREPRETTGYVSWGEYGRILSGYFDVFPRSQLLIVFTDELEVAPERLLQRIQRFVGAQEDFAPDNVGTRYRVGATAGRLSWLGTYSQLNPWGLQHSMSQMPYARGAWHLGVSSPFWGESEGERSSAFGSSSALGRPDRPFSGAEARVKRAEDLQTARFAERVGTSPCPA